VLDERLELELDVEDADELGLVVDVADERLELEVAVADELGLEVEIEDVVVVVDVADLVPR